jgi:hypothetical protein
MSINCDVILQWDATPKQIAALGTALWGWCSRAAGATGIYQHLGVLTEGVHPAVRRQLRGDRW